MILSVAAVYLVVGQGGALPVAIGAYLAALVWALASETKE